MRRALLFLLLPPILILAGCGQKEKSAKPSTEAKPAPTTPQAAGESQPEHVAIPHLKFNAGGPESAPAETKAPEKPAAGAAKPTTPPAPNGKMVSLQKPQMLVFFNPFYPLSARMSGLEGTVVVDFILDKEGNVVSPVISSSTVPNLSQYVLEAARDWKFQPAKADGQPIDLRASFPYQYVSEFGSAQPPPNSILAHLMKDFDTYYMQTKDGWKPAELDVTPIYRQEPKILGDANSPSPNGKVVLTFTVSEDGQVLDPKIVSSTNPALNKAALTAIKYWEFVPRMHEGKPVAARVQQTIDFVPPKDSAHGAPAAASVKKP